MAHPYSSTDTVTLMTEPCLISSKGSDFHMFYNLSIATHAFCLHILRFLSVITPRFDTSSSHCNKVHSAKNKHISFRRNYIIISDGHFSRLSTHNFLPSLRFLLLFSFLSLSYTFDTFSLQIHSRPSSSISLAS